MRSFKYLAKQGRMPPAFEPRVWTETSGWQTQLHTINVLKLIREVFPDWRPLILVWDASGRQWTAETKRVAR